MYTYNRGLNFKTITQSRNMLSKRTIICTYIKILSKNVILLKTYLLHLCIEVNVHKDIFNKFLLELISFTLKFCNNYHKFTKQMLTLLENTVV